MKFKKLITLFAVFIVTINIAYTSYAKEVMAPTTNPEIITTQESTTIMTMDLCPSYYETLTDKTEKEFYQTIEKLLTYYTETEKTPYIYTNMVITDKNKPRISEIAHMCLYDHPEYSVSWDGGLTVKNKSDIKLDITENTNCIISNDFYKEKLESLTIEPINDSYIAEQIFIKLSKEIEYDDNQTESTRAHWNDDYAALIEHKACCQGIAFAYKRLCNAANIPCVIITAYTSTAAYHMFNAVYINGTWKFCDLTEACCFPEKARQYFCLTEKTSRQSLMKSNTFQNCNHHNSTKNDNRAVLFLTYNTSA